MRRALLAVAAAGTVLALVLSAAMVLVVRQADRRHALERADSLATTLANEVLGPAFDSRDPDHRRVLDQLLGTRAQDGSVVRIKIWSPEGEIIWADDDRLIGLRFELEPEDQALVGTRQTYAELTDLQKPENEYEEGLEGSFIEVYAGFFDNRGRPLVFEAYLPVGELAAGLLRAELLRADLLALSFAWLIVLLTVLLPVAVWLARRVDRAQAEQQRLLRHAVEASELERRRLAQDLHDGVIQDLAGVGYVCSVLQEQLRDNPLALATARRAGEIVRRDVLALRSLSTDLYPPDLGGEGLEAALEEMLEHSEQEGLRTSLHVCDQLDLPATTALLAYRVVREALRNVAKHACASKVVVELRQSADQLVVQVQDDGTGFDPARRAPQGHLGLRVLRDSVTDLRGELELVSEVGGGTTLTARLPLS